METIKEKFMTPCTGCDGTGMFEEVYTTFGNEVKYRDVECGCEDGKDLDWQKVDLEIKATKQRIEELQEGISIKLELAKLYAIEENKELLLNAMKHVVLNESELLELEEYLEQLDSIE